MLGGHEIAEIMSRMNSGGQRNEEACAAKSILSLISYAQEAHARQEVIRYTHKRVL